VTKKVLGKAILIICILVFATLIGGYLYLPSTEPYQAAVRFIEGDKKVNSYLGEIVAHDPSPLEGWSLRYRGATGSAEFEIRVTGVKGKGVVYIRLFKSAGLWKVIQANLSLENGSVIPLVVEGTEKGSG